VAEGKAPRWKGALRTLSVERRRFLVFLQLPLGKRKTQKFEGAFSRERLAAVSEETRVQ